MTGRQHEGVLTEQADTTHVVHDEGCEEVGSCCHCYVESPKYKHHPPSDPETLIQVNHVVCHSQIGREHQLISKNRNGGGQKNDCILTVDNHSSSGLGSVLGEESHPHTLAIRWSLEHLTCSTSGDPSLRIHFNLLDHLMKFSLSKIVSLGFRTCEVVGIDVEFRNYFPAFGVSALHQH